MKNGSFAVKPGKSRLYVKINGLTWDKMKSIAFFHTMRRSLPTGRTTATTTTRI